MPGPDFDSREIADRAVEGTGCSREEALWLASACPLSALKDGAARIREAHFGRKVHFCAIVNARSGACSEDCKFCAQSVHYETKAETYGLKGPEALAKHAASIENSGADTFGIVTSGRGVGADDLETVCDGVRQILAKTRLAPCASLGELSAQQFAKLKAAGLKRYHHNLETSRNFFANVCTTHSWDDRLAVLKAAIEAGLEVCSGGLFGMGETFEDRVSLALVLRELGVGSVPVNFLNPVPGTPFEDRPLMPADEALTIIAVYRHLLPKATIRVCGGRPVVLAARQDEIFAAGANALMTGDYLTTTGISPDDDRALVEGLGLEVAGI